MQVGDVLCVLNAMKMETIVSSPISGRVTELSACQGATMTAQEFLASIREDA